MQDTSILSHHGIKSYVLKGTTLLNTLFLILHIGFGFFFYSIDATVIFYYNLFSVLYYLVGYVLLYHNKSDLYSLTTNLEIYVFMIFATVGLGWEYDFQQYCIIFVAGLLFTDYCTSTEHVLKKQTTVMIVTIVVTYFALRFWTYNNPPLYHAGSSVPVQLFYIANNALTFILLISYMYLYSQTVYQLEKALIEVASKDALTGLYNRRKMTDLLGAMSEILASGSGQPCIAMLDIDKFKLINDTYGHDSGDEVLKALGNILLEKAKEDERFHACRWGGEEFLIFYQRTNQTDEEIIAFFEALRRQIAETTVTHNKIDIHFTVTTGIALYQEEATVQQLIKQADNNLYRGKNSGRNVVIYE